MEPSATPGYHDGAVTAPNGMGDLPSLIGDNVHVQCVDGRFERYVNLDYARAPR